MFYRPYAALSHDIKRHDSAEMGVLVLNQVRFLILPTGDDMLRNVLLKQLGQDIKVTLEGRSTRPTFICKVIAVVGNKLNVLTTNDSKLDISLGIITDVFDLKGNQLYRVDVG